MFDKILFDKWRYLMENNKMDIYRVIMIMPIITCIISIPCFIFYIFYSIKRFLQKEDNIKDSQNYEDEVCIQMNNTLVLDDSDWSDYCESDCSDLSSDEFFFY